LGNGRVSSGEGSGYAAPGARLRQDGGARPDARAERAPRPQLVAWPRVNVHAVLRDGAADVWVRDASLGESSRRRLAAALSARLREAGLRPGGLFLNGEEIPY